MLCLGPNGAVFSLLKNSMGYLIEIFRCSEQGKSNFDVKEAKQASNRGQHCFRAA